VIRQGGDEEEMVGFVHYTSACSGIKMCMDGEGFSWAFRVEMVFVYIPLSTSDFCISGFWVIGTWETMAFVLYFEGVPVRGKLRDDNDRDWAVLCPRISNPNHSSQKLASDSNF